MDSFKPLTDRWLVLAQDAYLGANQGGPTFNVLLRIEEQLRPVALNLRRSFESADAALQSPEADQVITAAMRDSQFLNYRDCITAGFQQARAELVPARA